MLLRLLDDATVFSVALASLPGALGIEDDAREVTEGCLARCLNVLVDFPAVFGAALGAGFTFRDD